MVMVPLVNVKVGDRLIQDVYSVLGGPIMNKNRVISSLDLEVLEAFLIKQIEVECTPEHGAETAKATELIAPESIHFFALWMQLAEHVKKILEPSSVVRLPVLELRSLLEQLIQNIEQYQPMALRTQLQAASVPNHSNYLVHKSIAVSLTSYLIGKWADVAQKDEVQIALAGLLHDIGKSKINEDVLNRVEALSDKDIAEVRRHSQYGYEILRHTPAINEGVKQAALQHHERIDGNGYPLHVSGNQIHLYARIVAIADMFHAMTMDRNHKKAESSFIVLDRIQQESYGKLDPRLVMVFTKRIVDLTLGKKVRLNDNRVGHVVFIDPQHLTRPWISLDNHIIQLSQERNLHIEEIVIDRSI